MPANAGDGRDEISIPELGDPLEEEMATAPVFLLRKFWYSCLENTTDRGD